MHKIFLYLFYFLICFMGIVNVFGLYYVIMDIYREYLAEKDPHPYYDKEGVYHA